MITCRLAVCAEIVVRDAERNLVSAINLLEEMAPEGFPALLTRFTMLFILEREEGDPETFEAEIVLSIGEQELARMPTGGKFAEDGTIHRLIISATGIAIPRPGILSAVVLLDGTVRGSWHIRIKTPRTRPQLSLDLK